MRRSREEIGRSGRRLPVQLFSTALFNSYIWSPTGKSLCIPVLNCYSCPIGAVACPVGSLTSFMLQRRIPYYIIGFLGLIGVAVGRAFCGWTCPFGFLQDALYRIRSPKWKLPRVANGLKYVLLVVLVIGLPLALVGDEEQTAEERIVAEGTGAMDYCSLICPAGTLEAGLPAIIMKGEIRAAVSWRTWSKVGILLVVLCLMVFSRRSFCRALCPLGALMALTSRASLLQLHTDLGACTRCMRCVEVCPAASRRVPTQPRGKEATSECLLCLDCIRNCPASGALSARFGGRAVVTSKGNRNA